MSYQLIGAAIWDLFMDFSLLQSHARHTLLRDITALKSRWPYYVIMVLDPILRFNWVFYAIFTHDTQHSTTASFFVSFAEATRRGMWTLFRVENEHCANVAQYKASRDVPLPYQLEPLVERTSLESAAGEETGAAPTRIPSATSTGVDIHRMPSRVPTTPHPVPEEEEEAEIGTVRRRRAETIGRKSLGRIIAEAHKQDFEKRRKPETESMRGGAAEERYECEMHTDDEDEDSDSSISERIEVQEAEMLTRGARDGKKGVDGDGL
jgi:hypothetical protein